TQAGLRHTERVDRLVMFKRKQVAPERRTGKALLRQVGIFPYAILYKDGKVEKVAYGGEEIAEAQVAAKAKNRSLAGPYDDCYLTAGLCTHCPDCLIYGYAAIEAEGARKSRVMTDSCFSIRPYPLIQRLMKFNVIDEKTQTSGTITEYDYTLPEVFLPSVITTVDLTADEFVYVLGDILRTTRYGKESSRQGFIRNHILAIAFSDVELFANLEFTQALYDALADDPEINLEEGFLSLADVEKHVPGVLKLLTDDIYGRLEWVQGEELQKLLGEVKALYNDEARLAEFLRNLNTASASFVVKS
ncbi:MAG TPA: type I-D CRISPR-associated protein Cas7/Csc2, partial [Chloroflexi bacterium]|nr:type I-D CRISPR-associated protein Cas7/Csc2 [Chloroflexota bacterium]